MGMGKKSKDVHKFPTLFRILELLLAHDGLNAGRLMQKLIEEGYFNHGADEKTIRRLLNYYLKQLEDWGFIERRGRGRTLKWYLKNGTFRQSCYLTSEQKAILTTLLLSADEFTRNLFDGELREILKKLSFEEHTADAMLSDVNFRYLYGTDFKKLLPLMKKIFEALEGKRFISLLYMGERVYAKLLPLGFAIRNGRLYMVALEEKGEKRYFSLERISNLSLLDRTYPGKKFPSAGKFALFGDKPFVFGMRIDAKLYISPDFLKFHPLVFFNEGDDQKGYTLYMVGFDSDYFATRFMVFVFNEFYPPNGDMLKLAKEKELELLFPELEPDNGELQKERYHSFLRRLRLALRTRLRRVERALGAGGNPKLN